MENIMLFYNHGGHDYGDHDGAGHVNDQNGDAHGFYALPTHRMDSLKSKEMKLEGQQTTSFLTIERELIVAKADSHIFPTPNRHSPKSKRKRQQESQIFWLRLKNKK
ncbi:uncharacterized protein LOC111313983 [Durio zibethinus]|uniref:Uncharacterized protein LOC111313983 n=1 Tax=Durio zibethinus TaxID=66656 RepID=A0A6P6B0H6_DURZI|nr:uncharacterized protein LOC111313983 [Durio zibethinus]